MTSAWLTMDAMGVPLLVLVVAFYAAVATGYLEARRRREPTPVWARLAGPISVAAHLLGLVLLSMATERSPFTTVSQSLSFLAFSLAVLYLLLEATSRVATHGGGFYAVAALLAALSVPGLVQGFQALAFAVMGNPILDPELKNMVSHMASRASGCRYCQAHTATTAFHQGADPAKIAALWEFETSDRFSDAERAALRLAFNSGANAATPADFAACREHFDEQEIVAIVAVCALFGYLNRWNDTMATALEAEPGAFADETFCLLYTSDAADD